MIGHSLILWSVCKQKEHPIGHGQAWKNASSGDILGGRGADQSYGAAQGCQVGNVEGAEVWNG